MLGACGHQRLEGTFPESWLCAHPECSPMPRRTVAILTSRLTPRPPTLRNVEVRHLERHACMDDALNVLFTWQRRSQ